MGKALTALRCDGVDEYAPSALMKGLLQVFKGPLGTGAQRDIGRCAKAGIAFAKVGKAMV